MISLPPASAGSFLGLLVDPEEDDVFFRNVCSLQITRRYNRLGSNKLLFASLNYIPSSFDYTIMECVFR
jgi:hypothetical protein